MYIHWAIGRRGYHFIGQNRLFDRIYILTNRKEEVQNAIIFHGFIANSEPGKQGARFLR